jgi:hypothetical protein
MRGLQLNWPKDPFWIDYPRIKGFSLVNSMAGPSGLPPLRIMRGGLFFAVTISRNKIIRGRSIPLPLYRRFAAV